LLIERGFSRDDLKGEFFIRSVLLGHLDTARKMVQEDPRLDEGLIQRIIEERDLCKEDQKKVVALGGLHIIGTERHESRRVDNQLRGRSGRQGDPGWTQFYLSLEDDLIRIFGGDRILKWMERFGMQEEDVIEHPWITKAIENAQKRVEMRNFEIRKNLLEYDDVMNQQRTIVYGERRRILEGKSLEEMYKNIVENVVEELMDRYAPRKIHPQEWDLKGLREEVRFLGCGDLPLDDSHRDEESLYSFLMEKFLSIVEKKKQRYGEEVTNEIWKFVMIHTLDQLWKDHLLAMDHLKEGIGLRGYGQKDPKREYQREGFFLFQEMLRNFRRGVVQRFNFLEVQPESAGGMVGKVLPFSSRRMEYVHESVSGYEAPRKVAVGGGGEWEVESASPLSVKSSTVSSGREDRYPRVGRNDPCPCGSGKKYKKCHGKDL